MVPRPAPLITDNRFAEVAVDDTDLDMEMQAHTLPSKSRRGIQWVGICLNANGWRKDTARQVQEHIRVIEKERGCRVGMVCIQETKCAADTTKPRNKQGTRLDGLEGFVLMDHKARAHRFNPNAPSGGVAVFVHHRLQGVVQLCTTRLTAENFSGAHTVRVKTGKNRWQYIVNLYLELDRKRIGIEVNRDDVLEDLSAHMATLAKSGRAFILGDFQMRAHEPEMKKWMHKLNVARIDTGEVHTHRHYSEGTESTIDHVMAGKYDRWNDTALITDAETLEWEMGSGETAPSDHRMILFTLNLHAQGRQQRAKKKVKHDFSALIAQESGKNLQALRDEVRDLGDRLDRMRPSTDSPQLIDKCVTEVARVLARAMDRHVPKKKVAGFARSYDGRARHSMKDPAVRAALAAKDQARKEWRQAKGRCPRRKAKAAYKAACRAARDLQRTADRKYEGEQIKRLGEIRKMKHTTAAEMREKELIINFLKNKNPAVAKPMPGMYPEDDPAQLATCSDYAVCRGKRGAPEHQLCLCGQRKRENTEHAVLECPLYEGLREPLDRAMREHMALVLDEHAYAMSPSEALVP